ncbi:MAG: tRNA 4-thiouridine(8) synthase ThiI [Parasporobacterium sp.]|nr:tRNA 4-thiouridine(8) synthase ThiI [Parasporobacterium sp.]
MSEMLLIKYSEIGVKGKNRYVFEDMLVKNIKSALRVLDNPFSVRKTQGRIYVTYEEPDFDDAVAALTKVFGIAWICPVTQMDPVTFEELKKRVLAYMEKTYFAGGTDKKYTFKVNCRRIDKSYPMESMNMNMLLGELLLNEYPESLSVDVHDPDIMLSIEIRHHDINIYSVEIEGLNGMPVGTAGKAMLLLSGGIDSPVAGYLVSKRGVNLDAVYFHAPPYTSERAKQKVVDLAKIIARYSGPIRLHVVNFTDIQMKIYETCPHEELTIIMRRYMMKIAEELALKNNCLGLVTGESIGQVASQTMYSMLVTNEVCTLPVYRPLCAFDKMDIVAISEKIDAYETSILPYEDCCTIFVAKHPATKPKLEKIQKSEKLLEGTIEELYRQAVDTVEIIEI